MRRRIAGEAEAKLVFRTQVGGLDGPGGRRDHRRRATAPMGLAGSKAVARLGDPDVDPGANRGRRRVRSVRCLGALRIFSSAESPEPRRMAAGRALTHLWKDDQLVAEEEQAILRRGYGSP